MCDIADIGRHLSNWKITLDVSDGVRLARPSTTPPCAFKFQMAGVEPFTVLSSFIGITA
jgi:hypothetical protein